ncbi:carboxypeptidase-like regulatory domain-containing protein [Bacteroides sp. 519]|uniref:M56 family metallopeptidase n=1 Tax=Bacteroides sp. 519 TaxID=2302937 RepID=UPI0013D08845|nr:M56 family metallopeptidase [Bacteroides sp. 519]NDV59022.1 M56 family peptidase [Bacteroides sp. 519]
MGALFVYILKVTICLAVFYLFYRLLLSKETFHRFNRIAVLGILVLSLIIPLCEITVKQETEIHQTFLTVEQLLMLADMQSTVVAQAETATTRTSVQVILIVYLLGIVFLFCRNIYSLIQLCMLIRSGQKELLGDGIKLIIHTNTKLSPFSWMKHIVISQKDLEENGREILTHEMAHIYKWHSIDLLIADICIFFQWFNPAVWLLKQELQTIHEYQADETVIQEGVNAKEYQLLLIKKAVGTRLYSMANSFNHSKLKKRITMMLKEKSNPWARLKYLYILPVAAIAITAFARPEVSKEFKEISAVKVNDLAAIVETKSIENEPKELKAEPKEDIFSENSQVVSKGSDVVLHVEKELAVQSEEKDLVLTEASGKVDDVMLYTDTMKVEKIPDIYITKGKVPGSMLLTTKRGMFKENHPPLIVIDGEKVSERIMALIDPDRIEQISVLKDEKAVELYGEGAQNGVILITTKKEQINLLEDQNNNINVFGSVKDKSGNPIIGANVIIEATTSGTVTDMDGNFMLSADPDSYIIISYIDKETKKVKASTNKISVVLEDE